MSRFRVLVDSNILVSGIAFHGNEHRVLRLAEDGAIRLMLSDFILFETRRAIRAKFSGLESLLDLFLSRIPYELISKDSIVDILDECRGVLRDGKDAHILASVLVESLDYVLTGDKALRDDLNSYLGSNMALSSVELLELLGEN